VARFESGLEGVALILFPEVDREFERSWNAFGEKNLSSLASRSFVQLLNNASQLIAQVLFFSVSELFSPDPDSSVRRYLETEYYSTGLRRMTTTNG